MCKHVSTQMKSENDVLADARKQLHVMQTQLAVVTAQVCKYRLVSASPTACPMLRPILIADGIRVVEAHTNRRRQCRTDGPYGVVGGSLEPSEQRAF